MNFSHSVIVSTAASVFALQLEHYSSKQCAAMKESYEILYRSVDPCRHTLLTLNLNKLYFAHDIIVLCAPCSASARSSSSSPCPYCESVCEAGQERPQRHESVPCNRGYGYLFQVLRLYHNYALHWSLSSIIHMLKFTVTVMTSVTLASQCWILHYSDGWKEKESFPLYS